MWRICKKIKNNDKPTKISMKCEKIFEKLKYIEKSIILLKNYVLEKMWIIYVKLKVMMGQYKFLMKCEKIMKYWKF